MNPLLAIFAFLAALALATASDTAPSYGDCPFGIHVIVARASNEPPGAGIMGALANQILGGVPGSTMATLDYPAKFEPYIPSQTEGVVNLTKMIKKFAKNCPNTDIILMGYSQGAHVISDVLCGASENGFPTTKPLGTAITNKISAILLMGDPSFLAGQPYNFGSSHGTGIFRREKPEGCKRVDRKMMSICDAGDPFCEAGSDSLAVHMGYVATWGDVAVDFALAMVYSD
ncbi:cutinase [Dactylonectria macrodidyma]|uniref:Cutinase n=1 Tax=Dactylonectria macrodidyma TaxID=307937 RepID=A0A9P9F9U9_9HYPO|nr:cutinase [Dactylonectria macrodidyma]